MSFNHVRIEAEQLDEVRSAYSSISTGIVIKAQMNREQIEALVCDLLDTMTDPAAFLRSECPKLFAEVTA